MPKVKAIKNHSNVSKEEYDSVVYGARNVISEPADKALRSYSDPRNAPPARLPTLMGGVPGRTGTHKTKLEMVFSVGTAGFGYVSLQNPQYGGPYTDRAACVATTASFTGTTIAHTSATTGVNALYWHNGIAAAASLPSSSLAFRCTGLEMRLTPVESIAGSTPQNGRVAGLQEPNGASLSGKTFAQVASYTEAVDGTGVNGAGNDDSRLLKLVYRPKETNNLGLAYPALSPWQFYDYAAIAVDTNASNMVVCVQADASTQYMMEIYANWEIRGTLVQSKRSCPPDSRGMDLVCWALNEHRSSAYFGRPEHRYHAALNRIYHAVSKHGPRLEKETLVKSPNSIWNTLKNLVTPSNIQTMFNALTSL